MSKISAVICELNPLHIGHKYIFERAREHGDKVVAIMSGSFVQRGECAIFDKYRRAEAALLCGADLVVELPFPWCSAPAEFFARGALTVARAIGVDSIIFGSECGDTELIKRAAELSASEAFANAVSCEYTANTGYAAAREKAARRLDVQLAHIFADSNDMLALEYIKNVELCGYKGDFFAKKRISSDDYVSASGIREAVYGGRGDSVCSAIPECVKALFEEGLSHMAYCDKLFDLQLFALRQRLIPQGTFDGEGGILARLEKCADVSENGREMYRRAATKKYTDARIRRAALFALCGVTEGDLLKLPDHTVVLGANDKGREILSSLRKEEGFIFITKPSSSGGADCRLGTEADRLYTLLCEPVKESGYFLKCSPLIK